MGLKRRLKKTWRDSVNLWDNRNYYLYQKRRLQPKLSPLSSQTDFRQSQEILERILTQNILPFWYPEVIDSEYGGYRLNHDIKGNYQGKCNKHIVTQPRIVWFFSRLVNSSYGTSEYLKAAHHGYEFLYNCMWDKQFGGFYWEVDATGKNITKPDKHLYGQAFGLYALSEYAIASGNNSAKALAQKLFNLLESYAYDPQYGGYQEFFCQNWTLPSQGTKDCRNNTPFPIKTLDTHLHLMEAITPYYRLTQDPVARERLLELILILSNTVLRKNLGTCTNFYQPNWTPIDGLYQDRICYGHALENLWLLIETSQIIGISNAPLLDFYRTVFNYSLQYGFDRKRGGFYHFGYQNAPAHLLEKIWWIEAESLVSALYMYHLTREEVYRDCFCQTLDWIVKYQIDWEHGEWYREVGDNGEPSGYKAESWKGPYHNGRAMLQCLELLSSLNLE